MGIFDVFKSKPDVKEIGNLNCVNIGGKFDTCLLYTSPSPRDQVVSRMPSSA